MNKSGGTDKKQSEKLAKTESNTNRNQSGIMKDLDKGKENFSKPLNLNDDHKRTDGSSENKMNRNQQFVMKGLSEKEENVKELLELKIGQPKISVTKGKLSEDTNIVFVKDPQNNVEGKMNTGASADVLAEQFRAESSDLLKDIGQ